MKYNLNLSRCYALTDGLQYLTNLTMGLNLSCTKIDGSGFKHLPNLTCNLNIQLCTKFMAGNS